MIESWPVLLMVIAANLAVVMSTAAYPPGRWFQTIDKPVWTPPDWSLGPACGVIFILIASSGYVFVTSSEPQQRFWPLVLYGTHLLMMAAWWPVMFGLRLLGLAFGMLIAATVALGGTIFAFFSVSPTAAGLLAPYLAWSVYVTAVIFVVWRRNRARSGITQQERVRGLE
ncbi:TspO/MBR family protein [Acuticoccus kandeliae]|uniref:TspO/MBR family protein n=1 Tax=Acuticoccus kandeliae TaxID=2073160 RepID=UPI000D3E2FE1|nr:TspO/MBR family protein [Acuticoccus kandeliae]